MSKRVFNKKGFFLAEETLKIILAVICLGFLLFILGKLYYAYSFDKDLEQAKSTLAYLEKEVKLVKSGEPREVVIYSPSSDTKVRNKAGNIDYWILIGFSGADKPVSCAGKDCLCLCKNTWMGNMKEKCGKDGTCASFSGRKFSFNQIELVNLPMTVSITSDKDTVNIVKK